MYKYIEIKIWKLCMWKKNTFFLWFLRNSEFFCLLYKNFRKSNTTTSILTKIRLKYFVKVSKKNWTCDASSKSFLQWVKGFHSYRNEKYFHTFLSLKTNVWNLVEFCRFYSSSKILLKIYLYIDIYITIKIYTVFHPLF